MNARSDVDCRLDTLSVVSLIDLSSRPRFGFGLTRSSRAGRARHYIRCLQPSMPSHWGRVSFRCVSVCRQHPICGLPARSRRSGLATKVSIGTVLQVDCATTSGVSGWWIRSETFNASSATGKGSCFRFATLSVVSLSDRISRPWDKASIVTAPGRTRHYIRCLAVTGPIPGFAKWPANLYRSVGYSKP